MLGIHLDRVGTQKSVIKIVQEALAKRVFLHIASLNPENIMSAQSDHEYMQILNAADIQIIDGTGVLLASRWTREYKSDFERVTGVDLMSKLIESISKTRQTQTITIGFLGGRDGVAKSVCEKFSSQYHATPYVKFVNIADVESNDTTIVPRILKLNVDLLFVAFGSPTQEKWIDQHRTNLSHTVCMGVGGAFDMLSGRTPRASNIIRRFGLEWFYRLITQPWRWRRQMRILQFINLTLTKNY